MSGKSARKDATRRSNETLNCYWIPKRNITQGSRVILQTRSLVKSPGLENPQAALEWAHRGPYEHRCKKALVKPMAANLEVNINILVVEMSHMNVSSNIVQKDACARCTAYTFASYSIYMLKTRAKTDGKKVGSQCTSNKYTSKTFHSGRVPCLDKDLEGLPVPRVFARRPAQCVRCK